MRNPKVSVVIPARNESGTIRAAVEGALDQDYPGELEVIVAEGASSDDTRRVVEEMATAHPRLRVVDNPSGETAAGLNAAIAAAGGGVIIRCDGHARLPSDYVSTAVRILAETGAANVGGVQRAIGEPGWQEAIAIAMTSPLGVGDSRFHYGGTPGPTDTVYLGAFDRAILDEVGGFHEGLVRNQDYELNYRLRKAGHVVWFDPALEVTYRPRSSPAALWRQYFDYGRWKRAMLAANPGALRWRQLAPIALVLGLAASMVLSFTRWRWLASVVPLAYLLFLVAGTAAEGLRRRSPSVVLLPAVIPTMHIAWGLGFLVGSTRR